MITSTSKVRVFFEGQYWTCNVYDICGKEVALTCDDNPRIYRIQKWFNISDVEEITATPSVATFADRLGEALGLKPVKEETEKPEKTKIYLDAGTSVNRVIRSTGEHTGVIINQRQRVNVIEVYDTVNEVFYWTTRSYAYACEKIGHIVFW